MNDSAFRPDKSLALASIVEEMPAADVQLRLRLVAQAYSKALYAFGFFDSVDVYRVMVHSRLVPNAGAEVSRWFMNPSDFYRDPTIVPEAMGEDRWAATAALLEAMLAVYDSEVSPIVIAVKQHRLPAAVWVPLLRWLVSEGCEGDMKPNLGPFILAIANGNGPASLMLPKDTNKRYEVVGQLLLSAAKEFGRANIAGLATELLLSSGYEMGYRDQKTLMHIIGRANRRALDWQLRSSGGISNAVPSWKLYLQTAEGALPTEPIANWMRRGHEIVSHLPADGVAAEGEAPAGEPEEEEDAAAVTDFGRGIHVDEAVVQQESPKDLDPAAEDGTATESFTGSADDDAAPEDAAPVDARAAEAVDSFFEAPAAASADDEASVASFFTKEKRKSTVTAEIETLNQSFTTKLAALEKKATRAALKAGRIAEEATATEKAPKKRAAAAQRFDPSAWAERMLAEEQAATNALPAKAKAPKRLKRQGT